MTTPNTGATPTGPMTLEQGLIQLKSKMAESGTKTEDLATPLEPEEEVEGGEVEETTQTDETDAEAVSADESQEPAEPEADNRPVILPDGSQITVEEARKGYLRQADFTRKTQDVAREREQLTAGYQAKVKELEGLSQQLTSLQEQEPDWLAAAQDPNVDLRQLQTAKELWQRKKVVADQARREIANAKAMATMNAKAEAKRVLTSGEYNPEWTDEKKFNAGLDAVAAYLVDKCGYSDEFIYSITDPNIIVMADKARQLDELKAQKPKATLAVKGKPAPFKPGAKSTSSPQSENLRLLTEAFRNNPSIQNATRLEQAKRAASR